MNEETSDDLVFLASRCGLPTARVKTPSGLRYLHSAVDPRAEARAFADGILLQERSIPLVIGFGLGYHLEALFEREASPEKVIVLEPRGDVFAAACARRDLSGLLARDDLAVFAGLDDDAAVARLAALAGDPALKDRLVLVVHQASLPLYAAAFPRFSETLARTVTDTGAAHLMRENFLANADAVRAAEGVAAYAGRYAGKTCVIAAAGPSLTEALPALTAARDRVYLCAVTTALKPLLDAGLVPDLAVLADQQRIMRTHLDGTRDAGIPLLFLPTASRDAVAAHRGPRIVALQYGYPLCDDADAELHKGRLAVGGSVATLALSFALHAGFSRIVFAGLDLAYPDGQSHAAGVAKRAPLSATETAVSVRGTSVPTTHPMISFRLWIEKTIAAHPDRDFVNVSSGGARIAGTRECASAAVFGA